MTGTRSRRILTIALSLVLFVALPSVAQTTTAGDDLQKQIDALNEGQKAILRELQAIKALLQSRPAPTAPAETLPSQPIDISKDQVRGSPTAKVALIEYSDYQCSFCGRYDRDTFPQIDNEYIKTGKVRYVFRDLPLDFHKNAFKAAEAARCAGEQGKFWEMHAKLFANQQALEVSDLTQHAAAVNVDAGRFQQCLDSGRFATDIRRHISEASGAGLSGTPSFLIGIVQPNSTVKIVKKIVGARPYPEFKSAIDELLGSPAAVTR